MRSMKTQIGDVTYNAATQSFEALVTFYTDAGRIRVAARHPAPLDADFARVTDALWHNAMKSLDRPDALQARLQARRTEASRGPRLLPQLPAWLRNLTGQRHAA